MSARSASAFGFSRMIAVSNSKGEPRMDFQLWRVMFGFELRYWLRSMMFYVFLAIIALLAFMTTSSDNVSVGGKSENTLLNAGHSIQMYYAVFGLLTGAMVTAFVNAAASRDFSSGMHPIIFSQPVNKWPFLLGRFCGATLIAMLPMLGVTLGILVSQINPLNDPERFGPTIWGAHLWSWPVFVIPNTLLTAALIFAVAVWTRNTAASFLAVLLLLVGYIISGQLIDSLEQEGIAAMLDPFGLGTFELTTKYWTAAEKNVQYVTLSGWLLWNRILWMSVSLVVLAVAGWRFQFAERQRSGRRQLNDVFEPVVKPMPVVTITSGPLTTWQQFWSQWRLDFWGVIRSSIFVVVILFALLNTLTSLMFVDDGMFGLSSLPVTYRVIDVIRGSMYVFLLAVITFFAGALVWKERESRLDDVVDALPQPTWITYAAKLAALTLVVLAVLGVGALAGVGIQAIKGYTRFQPQVYAIELFGWDFVQMFCLMVLALLAHIISPNKYVGYFAFIVFVMLNTFGWSLLEWESRMFQYGLLPRYVYSDMFGWDPYLPGLFWFSVYWLLFALGLIVVSVLAWQRGRETGWRQRLGELFIRWRGGLRWASLAVAGAWAAVAIWVGYNTMYLNRWTTAAQLENRQVQYEEKFKHLEGVVQPRVTKILYEIDIYPEQRAIELRGTETLINRSSEPIEKLYFNLAPDYQTSIEVPGGKVLEDLPELYYSIYQLETPLSPGGELTIRYQVKSATQGFENSVSNEQVVQNGTFFNNQIAPQLGYQTRRELTNRNERRRRGMTPPRAMPVFEPENVEARQNHYLGTLSDWVDVESIISTSADQIAVGPGSLVEQWTKDGRRFFKYRLDHPSINFYSFISARYEVAQRTWNDVAVEVYYHPEHRWNVDKMLRSIQMSLEYCSREFGPYRHKQARIIEFPRVGSFAQAFPGTMPYSEGIGFIADLKSKDDIDMVYYVVAHEMAHQWWAHQVIGANMQGATLLSETLAQYSALMIMEREYGRDMMRKFLKYEMDNYLQGRGGELLREQPLVKVESQQGYIHYQKGSVVMYQLKEMIGEAKVNTALRSLIDRFGYAGPPYPTAQDLISALREQMTPDMHYLLEDLFERITLYDNRLKGATYRELADGKYEVKLNLSCQKLVVDEQQQENPVPMNDWIEIGAFAAPPVGSSFGDTLYRQRVQLTAGDHELKFVVDQVPHRVGVDPFYLLIDRMPEDNLQKPIVDSAQ